MRVEGSDIFHWGYLDNTMIQHAPPKNKCLAEMCSGSEEGSDLRRMFFVSLDSRLESHKLEEDEGTLFTREREENVNHRERGKTVNNPEKGKTVNIRERGKTVNIRERGKTVNQYTHI